MDTGRADIYGAHERSLSTACVSPRKIDGRDVQTQETLSSHLAATLKEKSYHCLVTAASYTKLAQLPDHHFHSLPKILFLFHFLSNQVHCSHQGGLLLSHSIRH